MEVIILLTLGSVMWVTGALFVVWFVDIVVDMFLAFIGVMNNN